MMQPPWKKFLLFIKIITMLAGAVVAVKVDNACRISNTTPYCSQHHLQCDRGIIFIAKAIRGFKAKSHSCPSETTHCPNEATCCHNDAGTDCLQEYEQGMFYDLALDCWRLRSCHYQVKYAGSFNCGSDYRYWSGYSEVQYLCLADSAIHEFSEFYPMTASSLALRHVFSDDGLYVCLVEAEDCSSRTADVMLAKWPNTYSYSSLYCSSLGVNDEAWLPCSRSLWYATYTLTTPFRVRLTVLSLNDVTQAWAVIHATDSSTLQVKCKQGRFRRPISFPQCSSPSTSPKTDPPTRPGTSMPSAFASSHSTGSSDTSAADVTSPSTASDGFGSSPDVMEGTMPQSEAKATPTTKPSNSALPPSPKTDPPTRPGTSMPSYFASSQSTGSSDTSAADDKSLSTASVASGSSPDLTEAAMPQSEDNTGSTAAVVGGVVGAVLVVLLVALVVTLVFLKRRNTTGKTSKVVTWIKGGNSSNPPHGNSPAAKTSEYGRAVPHVTPAQPTSLPAYEISMAAITDEAGSDYNRLHQKPTSSTPRDVTYGHLADSNDVTDYGYDHVTKGKPAVHSGDVINNVYNTAGKATGAPSDEDFYNVAGAAKNRPDVINNVYNTPSPATEASSDGDYYNVTGLPQSGRDVIDNVYDTPKPAAAPGLVETEGCDVTGVNAGSPC